MLPLQTGHLIIPTRLPSSRPSILQQSGPSQCVPPSLCPLSPNQLGVPTAHLHTSRLEALLLRFHTSSRGGLPANSSLDNRVVNQPSENFCKHIGLVVPATPGPSHVLSLSTEFPRGLHHPLCSSALVPAYSPWSRSPAGVLPSVTGGSCTQPPAPSPQPVKHRESRASVGRPGAASQIPG